MASTVTGDFGSSVKSCGKLGFHLRDVAAKIVEDLLGGSGNIFGIGFERSAK